MLEDDVAFDGRRRKKRERTRKKPRGDSTKKSEMAAPSLEFFPVRSLNEELSLSNDKKESVEPLIVTKVKEEISLSDEIAGNAEDHSVGQGQNEKIGEAACNGKRAKWICKTCGKTFPRKSPYSMHIVKHSLAKPYLCDVCNMTFKRKASLKTHRELHTGIRYTCDYCKLSTPSKTTVSSHIRRAHLREFRFTCDQCGKRCMRNCDLKKHKPLHLGVKSFICDFCGNGFTQQSVLNHHKRIVHGLSQKTMSKNHKCPLCEKSCSSEYRLRVDVESHARRHYCAKCDKQFVNNASHQLHNRRHTGERPYQCDKCSKTFVRSSTFAKHKLAHTGARPYVCDICGKCYTHRTNMMLHRKKHPGDHPIPPRTAISKLVR